MRTGLIGWPLGHSFSPAIHNLAFKMVGLDGVYQLFPIEPDDKAGLERMVERTRSGELTGFNITIPHKVNILPYLDEVLPIAESVGAVNTVLKINDKVIGTNTDAPGFLADMIAKFGGCCLENGRAVVFGSGGSAKAVIYSLLDRGIEVTVVARDVYKADSALGRLIKGFPNFIQIMDRSKFRQANMDSQNLFINTTPLGMYPKVDASALPNGLNFPRGSYVYDLVYNPAQTLFVQQGITFGCQATSGFGMLVEQALLAFELWTGKAIDRDEFYSLYNKLDRSI